MLHSFAKPPLFFQTGLIFRIYKSKSIYGIGNYFKHNISGALVVLFSFFIITAMPPSGMFVSEFMIFRSMFESGNWWMLILILLFLTLIIWSFGRNVFKILFIPAVGFNDDNIEKISAIESLSHFFLLAIVIYLGLFPPAEFVNLINATISNLPH